MAVAIAGIGVVSRPWLTGAVDPAAELEWDIPSDAVPAEGRARLGRLDRLCRLMLQAAHQAVADAGLALDADAAERVGLCFGTGLGCLLTDAEFYQKIVEQGAKAASPRLFAYTVSSAAAGEVSIALGLKGPNATEHAGLAAGLSAVGHAFDWLESGRADAVLAGGGDACGPALVDGLRAMGLLKTAAAARPFRDATPGIRPAEGAVVLVLRNAVAPPRLAVAGYAAGFEPTLAGARPQARGIAETMRRALAQAGIAGGDVDLVIGSAHGTPLDAAELAAVRDVLGARPLVFAPKAVFGETFAASPLLGLALLEALRGHRGTPLAAGADPAVAELRALPRASVVMLNALCYSGAVVSLLLTRRE